MSLRGSAKVRAKGAQLAASVPLLVKPYRHDAIPRIIAAHKAVPFSYPGLLSYGIFRPLMRSRSLDRGT